MSQCARCSRIELERTGQVEGLDCREAPYGLRGPIIAEPRIEASAHDPFEYVGSAAKLRYPRVKLSQTVLILENARAQ